MIEEENFKLKRILAEKELEIQALTEIIKKTYDLKGAKDAYKENARRNRNSNISTLQKGAEWRYCGKARD